MIPITKNKEKKADAVIPVSVNKDKIQLIEINKNKTKYEQGTWIHPDLAIQLAQWISPTFALKVSQWIRELFSNGKVSIEIYEKRIKLLENKYVKKHKRKDYDENNVIYMLTTKDYKERRIYIIGKATDLKNRLSSYNKTIEHEVTYHKTCNDEETMNLVENMVLKKMNNYREIANRDRFILPIDKDISYFKNIIDECINFFN